MILPPTQHLVSCSFGLTGRVEFPELLCGPDLGKAAPFLVVCEGGGEVEAESPTSFLGDGNREHNTLSSSVESTYSLGTFLSSKLSAESFLLASSASLFLSV